MPKVFELRKERAAKAADARKIVELAISEKRDNTPEERTQLDKIVEDIGGYDRKIAVLERVENVESEGERSLGRQSNEIRSADDPLSDTKHQYSLLRAYRCLVGMERGGLEDEVNKEIAVRSGKPAQGFYIPWNLHNPAARRQALEQRSLSTSTGSGSIASILGSELIELLRNKMVLNRMGARVMTDMTGGTFSLPKQTGTTTAYWVAEGSAPSASNLTVGQVTWTPKTVGAFTDLTRKFMLQTNQAAESLARDDLTRLLAIEMDRAGVNGSGSGQTPLGILQDSSIPTIAIGTNGGAPTWPVVTNLEKTVAQSNADFGKLGYVTSNAGRSKLKNTPKIGTTFPVFMWERDNQGEGEINGYRALASEQVPSNLTKGSGSNLTALIYGNWDSATYAFWSGLDLLLDPYTGSSAGTLRVVALQDCDIQFRYEASFAKVVDLDPS